MRPIVVAVILLAIPAVLDAQQTAPPSVAVPDSVVRDGIPPIPASVADTTLRYKDFRFASLQAWHPSSRQMLITTQFGTTSQIHSVAMPGGARTQLTFFPDAPDSASYEPSHGKY